jgi:anti-anti-sigma factor
MKLETLRGPGSIIVVLQGKFDDSAVATVRPQLELIPRASERDVYIDLRRVTYIDSAAVGALVFLFKRLVSQRRRLVLIGAAGQPRRLLELLRIDRVIETSSNLPSGLLPELAEQAA